MSKRRQSRHPKAVKREEPCLSRAIVRSQKRPLLIAAGVLVSVFSVAVLAFAFTGPRGDFGAAGNSQANATSPDSDINKQSNTIKPASLDELLALPEADLAKVDLAVMNLLCAVGLPGAEKLDIDHALATLDKWAQRVKYETERHLYRAHDPRWADHYRHSEAYLRAEFLMQVLYEDLGVGYNLAAKDNFDFDDSRVALIHGMIPAPGQALTDTPGGTCASMPVLVTAIGRRLGYPLKLATTQGHVFVRWDGQSHSNPAWRERFNMEVTNGFNSYEDEYYKTWPFKLTEAQVKANRYLVSLTPAEEFADFLAARGHCGADNGQIAFAARCYENAYRYDTTRPAYRAWFLDAAMNSGYRPVTPTLARMLAERVNQIASARRGSFDSMTMSRPSDMVTMDAAPSLPPVRFGQSQPQIPQSHVSQIPQHGFAQPYQPPVSGQSPR